MSLTVSRTPPPMAAHPVVSKWTNSEKQAYIDAVKGTAVGVIQSGVMSAEEQEKNGMTNIDALISSLDPTDPGSQAIVTMAKNIYDTRAATDPQGAAQDVEEFAGLTLQALREQDPNQPKHANTDGMGFLRKIAIILGEVLDAQANLCMEDSERLNAMNNDPNNDGTSMQGDLATFKADTEQLGILGNAAMTLIGAVADCFKTLSRPS